MPTAAEPTTGEREVLVQHDVAITMADGVELAANLCLPADGDGAWPGIMTFIPYHKDGRGGAGYLDAYHRHFAARGYAVLHVDFRGTGSSGGAPYRTMDGRERLDGHHIVEWMARQPWCTGDVDLWGVSYGGITAMAIAETHPPHLRAIVPIHAPDDNYEAMIVHRGARLMFWPDPHWGAGMAASNLMPALRSDGAGDWLKSWEARLASDPWLFDWYGSPPTPDHWRNASVNAGEIDVPAFVICGWQDAYPDSVHRLWPQLQGPKRLLLGPWKHVMPEFSVREPIDVASEIDRWWDRWLKGIENGVDEEAPVAIFVQGAESWRQEHEWPPARLTETSLFPDGDHGLTDVAVEAAGDDGYAYDARVGLHALPYDACTGPIPYPQDQSADDHLSLCYTGAPLSSDLEVTGVPTVRLAFAVDVPVTEITLVAKLCDVAPDGQSRLVTFDHVAGDRAELVDASGPESIYAADIALRPTSHVFRAGHRIRLALSGGNFPYLWPSPRRYRLRVLRGAMPATTLTLPVVGPQEPALPVPTFGPPLPSIASAKATGEERYWTQREETGSSVSFEGKRTTELSVQPGTHLSIAQHFVMTVEADCPSRANTRTDATWELKRATGAVEVRATTITTLHDVHVEAAIDLDGFPYLHRSWRKHR
jgi:uncharacterized protein